MILTDWNDSLWNKSSGILAFTFISSLYCGPRTLEYNPSILCKTSAFSGARMNGNADVVGLDVALEDEQDEEGEESDP